MRVRTDGSQEVAGSEELVAFVFAPLRVLLLGSQVFGYESWNMFEDDVFISNTSK